MFPRKSLPLLALTLTAIATGCGGNPSSQSTNLQAAQPDPATIAARNACDGMRIRLRKRAMREFGIRVMVEQARLISRQITPEDRADLRRLGWSGTLGVPYRVARRAGALADQIYADAMQRAGLKRGIGVRHPEIRRQITPVPLGYIAIDGSGGFLGVMKSDGDDLQKPENIIAGVFLAVNADQTQYKPIFEHVVSFKATGYGGGSSYEIEHWTMSQFVNSQLPSECLDKGTSLPTAQLDLIPAAAAPAIGA